MLDGTGAQIGPHIGPRIGPQIGQRIREVRVWRGLSLRAAAELAGFSESYLSMIERGLRPVDRRSTLEAFANALRVAPSELTGGPFLLSGTSTEHAAVAALRSVLCDYEIGEPVDASAPPWPHIEQRLNVVNELRPKADYATLGQALPGLVRDLHACLEGPHSRAALEGLADCYLAAQAAAKNLGMFDLAQVAARHVRDVAFLLSGPEWVGLAAWSRAQAISSAGRPRAYAVATRAADAIAGEIGRPEVADVYGSLHLTAALAAVTSGDHDEATSHIDEAADIARRPGVGTGFGNLSFGSGNVEIWRTLVEVEAGNGGKAVEVARKVDPATLPKSATRRAAWWVDIGRGLATERGTRDEVVRAFRTAEDLAPQRVRSNPWVRETVTDLLTKARRDAGGRELRGLAYRIGLAT